MFPATGGYVSSLDILVILTEKTSYRMAASIFKSLYMEVKWCCDGVWKLWLSTRWFTVYNIIHPWYNEHDTFLWNTLSISSNDLSWNPFRDGYMFYVTVKYAWTPYLRCSLTQRLHREGLEQYNSNPIANALESLQSCTKPSTCQSNNIKIRPAQKSSFRDYAGVKRWNDSVLTWKEKIEAIFYILHRIHAICSHAVPFPQFWKLNSFTRTREIWILHNKGNILILLIVTDCYHAKAFWRQ